MSTSSPLPSPHSLQPQGLLPPQGLCTYSSSAGRLGLQDRLAGFPRRNIPVPSPVFLHSTCHHQQTIYFTVHGFPADCLSHRRVSFMRVEILSALLTARSLVPCVLNTRGVHKLSKTLPNGWWAQEAQRDHHS